MASAKGSDASVTQNEHGERVGQAHQERTRGCDVQTVEATVFAVIPEYGQARVKTEDGLQCAITRHTAGVRLGELHEGQRLVCTVTVKLPRVIAAEVLG